jgi:hypothetical protein
MDDCPTNHERTVFDRTVCPSPCDMMHTHCLDCGEALDRCYWDDH